jgi:outer membrane protein assembly factor BamA
VAFAVGAAALTHAATARAEPASEEPPPTGAESSAADAANRKTADQETELTDAARASESAGNGGEARPAELTGRASELPDLTADPGIAALLGRKVSRIELKLEGARWTEEPVAPIGRVKVGDVLDVELARRGLEELADRGEFAELRVEAFADGDGVRLRYVGLPRRLVEDVELRGGSLSANDVLRAADVGPGDAIVASDVLRIAERVRDHYARHGFPNARVQADLRRGGDHLNVRVQLRITPGAPVRVEARRFFVTPDPTLAPLRELVAGYRVRDNQRLVEEELIDADRDLEKRLRGAGWHQARVSHELAGGAASKVVHVLVDAGPFFELELEGLRTFDASQIRPALELESSEDRSLDALAGRLKDYYRRRGFLDVDVETRERREPNDEVRVLAFRVREGVPVQVASREYPCLSGPRSARDVGREIDSFLSEELPGTGLVGGVDPKRLDALYGPAGSSGTRVKPYTFNPWRTYVPEVYDRAIKHLQELFRSEGYLSATVGPAQLTRRQCALRSQPDECLPVGPQPQPKLACRYDPNTREPLPEPRVDTQLACKPDPRRGIRCEPEAKLVIPIKLGPQSELYDFTFDGNRQLVESRLAEAAGLRTGTPVSLTEIERARRRVLEAYAEDGFAFANVETDLELSPDRTRARVRFVISEGERVRVTEIVIRGARRTKEKLIRRRVALSVGGPYRQSLVRLTEERLALLGVFSNVAVSLEDPEVPAREKVVIVSVQEEVPQYVETLGGVSSGEGVRGTLGYGHRNLGGAAIQLRAQFHASYLPDPFIVELEVRQRFQELELQDRLERNSSLSLEFPEIGLGPLFRLNVEALDVRDNSRDFGLTRQASLVTLIYRPRRRIAVQLGPTLEINNAQIFGAEEEKGALDQYVRDNPGRANLFRVPQDRTFAFAQQISATWDRRDNPLSATRGTFLSARVEHVRAVPQDQLGDLLATGRAGQTEENASVFAPIVSEFVRLSGRAAGYVPFNARGLSLGVSVAAGINVQTFRESRTYPDRLFFLGGADSIRGFFQASLIPEDIARELLDESSNLNLSQVVIRGGDFFLNPRTELRVPLGRSPVQGAVFVDSGNLWADARNLDAQEILDPRSLRYSTGAGIRVATPVGPLVFDYGLNVHTLVDRTLPGRTPARPWEDLGAFHFSIGVF